MLQFLYTAAFQHNSQYFWHRTFNPLKQPIKQLEPKQYMILTGDHLMKVIICQKVLF